jgi:DNA-binding NtrC family response regulator
MSNRRAGKEAHILIADDDALTRYSLKEMLLIEGYSVDTAEDGEKALAKIKSRATDVIIADISMPGIDGFNLLEGVKHQDPESVVILITGYGSISDAVKGMRLGAYDYLTKPINDVEMKILLERALEHKKLRLENQELKRKLADKFQFDGLIGTDSRMKRIFDLLSTVAASDATILISGSNGTGKSTIARAVHYRSRRKEQPLVEISCGALSENLLESELFGHVKGSFTSASADKMGKLEKAEGGTVFLDEIDTLSLGLQVKLLRFLQEKKFEKVGSTDTIHSNVRVIAAANRDLKKCIELGEFRQDLYYRLNVVAVHLPPLVDRLPDVPLFIDHFIQKYNGCNAKTVGGVSGEVLERLLSHDWPGNVRELENVIERAVILSTGEYITSDLLPDYLRDGAPESSDGLVPLHVVSEIANKNAILIALRYFKGSRTQTAQFLGINRTTLYKKMKKYGIANGEFK